MLKSCPFDFVLYFGIIANMKRLLILTISAILINSCAQNNTDLVKTNNKVGNIESDKTIYKSIYKNIKQNNLDNADDLYVKLKSDYENSPLLKNAATILAIAHMQNKEHILANFYIQEALQNSSDDNLKYLFAKNQFMAAVMNSSDNTYIKKAKDALKSYVDIIADSDYQTLANSFFIRLKLQDIYNNLQTGALYNRLGKKEAYKIYRTKAMQDNIDINSIYKP